MFGHDQPVDRMNEYLLTILQYEQYLSPVAEIRLSKDCDSYVVARVRAQRFLMVRCDVIRRVCDKSWRMQTALTDGGGP